MCLPPSFFPFCCPSGPFCRIPLSTTRVSLLRLQSPSPTATEAASGAWFGDDECVLLLFPVFVSPRPPPGLPIGLFCWLYFTLALVPATKTSPPPLLTTQQNVIHFCCLRVSSLHFPLNIHSLHLYPDHISFFFYLKIITQRYSSASSFSMLNHPKGFSYQYGQITIFIFLLSLITCSPNYQLRMGNGLRVNQLLLKATLNRS